MINIGEKLVLTSLCEIIYPSTGIIEVEAGIL